MLKAASKVLAQMAEPLKDLHAPASDVAEGHGATRPGFCVLDDGRIAVCGRGVGLCVEDRFD